MTSKLSDKKKRAILLRQQGLSIRDIEVRLSIPRSTLSGWLRHIALSSAQQEVLKQQWRKGLMMARKRAVVWHRTQKEARLEKARDEAQTILMQIPTENVHILELALAILYLAEGSKRNTETALGSSDAKTLSFFLYALKRIYDFNISSVRAELYLRADQDPEKMKRYWSKELRLPLRNFKQVNLDKRSVGNTYPRYKGVCSLRCGNVAIQRRLVYLAEAYFDTFKIKK